MKNQPINVRPERHRALALSLGALLAVVGSLQASTVTETFDTSANTAANGWTGSGNTAGGNNFGWSATDFVLDDGGEAGGIFARSSTYRYFADISGGSLSRSGTLRLAGSFNLANQSFDGEVRLGFFKTDAIPNNFIGISFAEPSSVASGPFRGFARVDGVGGAASAIIDLDQAVTLTFDLTWTGNPDGSGSLAGTLADKSVNVAVEAGSGSFNAFGLLTGGSASNNVNERTGECYFDGLTYTKVPPANYTIIYNGNGNDGGTVPDPQTKIENQPLVLATNSGTLVKDGLTFVGWSTEADGSGVSYNEGATFSGNSDLTLYARWGLTYTITYDGNGNDSGTAPEPQLMVQELSAPLAANSGGLAKDGLVFFGWNTAADGAGTNYAAGASYTGTADITLYANWGRYTWIPTVAPTAAPFPAWATTSNWLNGLIPPGGAHSGVNITPDIVGNQTVALAATRHWGATVNLGLAGNSFGHNFSNNTTIFRVNTGNTMGTATLNLLGGGQHVIQGTVNLQVDHLVINNHSAGTRLNFARALNDSDGDPNRSPTVTLNAVEGAGAITFSTNLHGGSNLGNGWEKLIINQHGIVVNNRTIVDGLADDRALGKELTETLEDAITLNGGTLTLGGSATYNVGVNRGITLGEHGGTFLAPTATRHWAVDSIIRGIGQLTVAGPGTVTLKAVNSYEGDTIVNGTLIVTGGNAIPDSGTLVINEGGLVNPSGTTETVAALFFGEVEQAAGSWGAADSGATNISDTYFTGTGVINVVPGGSPSGFGAWQTANGTSGALEDDHDNDGVSNGIEWFLGGNSDTTGFTPLPAVESTSGISSVTWIKSADYGGSYGADFRVETSATLAAPWTTAAEGVGAGFVEITGNQVKFTFPAGSKDFARLVVTGP